MKRAAIPRTWMSRSSAHDAEGELAGCHVAVDGDDAIHDGVAAGRDYRQRHAQERGVHGVHASFGAVDAAALPVEEVGGAEGRLQALREPELHLGWHRA